MSATYIWSQCEDLRRLLQAIGAKQPSVVAIFSKQPPDVSKPQPALPSLMLPLSRPVHLLPIMHLGQSEVKNFVRGSHRNFSKFPCEPAVTSCRTTCGGSSTSMCPPGVPRFTVCKRVQLPCHPIGNLLSFQLPRQSHITHCRAEVKNASSVSKGSAVSRDRQFRLDGRSSTSHMCAHAQHGRTHHQREVVEPSAGNSICAGSTER